MNETVNISHKTEICSRPGEDEKGPQRSPGKGSRKREKSCHFAALFNAAAVQGEKGSGVAGVERLAETFAGFPGSATTAACGAESRFDHSIAGGHGQGGTHFLSLRVETAGRGVLGVEILAEEGRARLKITAPVEESCLWVKQKEQEIARILAEKGLALEGLTVECSGGDAGKRPDPSHDAGSEKMVPAPGNHGALPGLAVPRTAVDEIIA
jgi:hypothetical protein